MASGKTVWTWIGVINAIAFGTLACVIIFLCIFVLFPVLMAKSFNKVDQDEMAIKYYGISNEIVGDNEDDILGEGLHYDKKPDTELIRYPDIFINKEFKGDGIIKCLSKDGLDMEMVITVQYKLIRKELYDVLDEFGDNEDITEYVVRIIRNAIKNGCSKFTAGEYFTKRDEAEVEISKEVERYLNVSKSHNQYGDLQLKNIKHPRAFEIENEKKQLAEQDILVATNERVQALTEAQTLYLEAEEDNKVKIIKAQADVDVILINANRTAEGTKATWEERTNTFTNIKEELGLTGEEFVQIYLRYLVVKNGKDNIIKIE